MPNGDQQVIMAKRALITGANRGIGLEIARQLGQKGWHILMGARNAERGAAAAATLKKQGITVEPVKLDVSDPESARDGFQEVLRLTDHLDVLINNAAVLYQEDQSLLSQQPGFIQDVIQTNALGGLLVVQVFRPLLLPGSQVLFMSSGGGSMSDPVGGWSPAYCVSKTLMNSICRHLAFEMRSMGVSVHAVCPGWVRTEMGGAGAPQSVEQGADTMVWLADQGPQGKTGLLWRDRKVVPW
ncbi:MAG: SDR family NAD(P)-dependent oxidoreductase [Bacteroidetes bacterium]|nr:MAG: SDR family NAD(P)-dependent oxidoreductase [Bacteroidota bacterium]